MFRNRYLRMDTRRVRMPGADAGPYILPLLQGVDDGARKKKRGFSECVSFGRGREWFIGTQSSVLYASVYSSVNVRDRGGSGGGEGGLTGVPRRPVDTKPPITFGGGMRGISVAQAQRCKEAANKIRNQFRQHRLLVRARNELKVRMSVLTLQRAYRGHLVRRADRLVVAARFRELFLRHKQSIESRRSLDRDPTFNPTSVRNAAHSLCIRKCWIGALRDWAKGEGALGLRGKGRWG